MNNSFKGLWKWLLWSNTNVWCSRLFAWQKTHKSNSHDLKWFVIYGTDTEAERQCKTEPKLMSCAAAGEMSQQQKLGGTWQHKWRKGNISGTSQNHHRII